MIDATPQESRELQVFADAPPREAVSDIAAFFDVPPDAITVEGCESTPEVVLRADGEKLLAAPLDRLWEAVTTTAEVIRTGPDPQSIIERLDTTTFRSHSARQLVVASRYVERRAERAGEGSLYACFQHLSRLEADLRTLLYYSVLARSDLDVHLLGVQDTELTDTVGLRIHDSTSDELARTWLVVYDGNGSDDLKAALVAEETGNRQFRGFWTVDPDRVDEIIDYLTETYLDS